MREASIFVTIGNMKSQDASCFSKVYDVAVCGAGLVGFAAARALASEGREVLLFEPSTDLLWEITRSFECEIAGGNEDWLRWIDGLRSEGGVASGKLDLAVSEIVAARQLLEEPRVSTLFGACPVAAQVEDGVIRSLTVGTKSGFRILRARHWIDATEQGQLAQACGAEEMISRRVLTSRRSVLIHALEWQDLEKRLQTRMKGFPGGSLEPTSRANGRRCSWTVGADSRPTDFIRKLGELRKTVPDRSFLVSLISLRDFPVYEEGQPTLSALPSNLLVLSPALRQEVLELPGDRFALGSRAGEWMEGLSSKVCLDGDMEITLPLEIPEVERGVLVGGAGTAGAIAAIVSARNGAGVMALDCASIPGGVGTGGGISGYFHGASGGIQDQVDVRSGEITALLTGFSQRSGWHYAAKALALLEEFEGSGVTYCGDAFICGVEMDSPERVGAVLAIAEGRLVRYRAKAFVDCTGDGDLCAWAGASFVQGRPGDGRSLAYSLPSFVLREAKDRISLGSRNFDAGWMDATDPEELSRAKLTATRQHRTGVDEGSRALAIVPLLGVRQSRHIHTDTTLVLNDLIEGKRFPDDIGETKAVLDTHSVDFEFESDEMIFYQWVCRAFRQPLQSGMRYGILLPVGLENVWIACRAAGVSVDAACCVRMERDMQRLGEAAGAAAALAVRGGVDSRAVDLRELQSRLQESGARAEASDAANSSEEQESPLVALDRGEADIGFWAIYRSPEKFRDEVLRRLDAEGDVSFYAACILAMWGDSCAEECLIRAVRGRETGHPPTHRNRGAFGQTVVIPHWVLALVLLRRCGTAACVPVLKEVASQSLPFNLRTILALTIEQLAEKPELRAELAGIFRQLEEAFRRDREEISILEPSRSLWRTLDGEPPLEMPHRGSVEVRIDHSHQMDGVLGRIRKKLAL